MKARELEQGMALGRYRLEQRIGEGGMGSVWLARDEQLERDVALKALPRSLITDASAGRRFEREARAMGRLQHPNVVGIYDIGRADPGTGEELRFLVMELVRGRPLNQVISEAEVPLRTVLLWMEQVARALAEAHRAGIVHRDLKPSNIMVDADDHVVVLDFGLARLTQTEGGLPEESLTTPGMVLGSCPYMAPEQALGQEVTPASDIFSFGTVLYEVLARERAFKGETPMRVLQAVVRCELDPLEDRAPSLPDGVLAIVERCLSRDPAARYPNADELASDLAVVAEMEASSPSAVPTMMANTGGVAASRIRRRRRWRRLAAAAFAAVTIGTVVGLWLGRAGQEPLRPDPGGWEMTELMHGSGDLYRPRWSPSGNAVAVARTQGSSGAILMVTIGDDDPRVVLEGDGDEVPGAPSFSPDAAALAVSVLSGSRQQVRVIPTVGGPPVAEIDNALHGVWLDRETLVFSRIDNGRSSIWSRDLSSGEERLRVAAEDDGLSWWEAQPRPGGGFALLGGPSDLAPGIFVGDESGETIDEWLAPGQKVWGVSWLPDGTALVASIAGQLARITENGAQPLLPGGQQQLKFPALADDGRLVAVANDRSYDILSVDPDGGPPDCLVCNTDRVGWGSLGVDGMVVFRRQASDRIVRRGRDGIEHPLTGPGERASCPVMSPDGARIAYLARLEGSYELRVRPVMGGEPVTLADDVEASEFVSWSPDGSRIAYAGGSPLRVWVVSAAGGEPRAVSGSGGDYPVWSPDGASIAYAIWTEESDPAQGTWIVGRDGIGARKVSDLPTRVVWDPVTGDLLQLRRSTGEDALELWQSDGLSPDWRRRSRLDLAGPPSVQMEYLPLTVDPSSGRLVMNRLTVESRLVIVSGLELPRWAE